MLIDDTSRLGRNLGDVLKVAELFEHYGVFLYFVTQRLDSRTANFRQLLIMFGMVDEQYVANIRTKTHRGQKGRVLNGYVPGGKCYGYKNVPELDPSRKMRGHPAVIGVRLEIIPEEAAVVREIFEMYESGYSLVKLAKTLNKRGVTPPDSGRQWSSHAWSYLTIRDMLRRDKYQGVHKWNRTRNVRNPLTSKKEWKRRPQEEVVIISVPEWRIVSEALWDRVQKQIQLRQRFGSPRLGGLSRTGRTYLFSGLLKCGLCTRKITVIGKHGDIPIYGCPSHRYNGVCLNDVVIRQDKLEQQLLDHLVGHLLRPENLEYTLSGLHDRLQKREIENAARKAAESPILEHQQAELENQQKNLIAAIKEGGRRQSLLSELEKIELQLEAITTRADIQSEVKKIAISKDQLRDFVLQKAHDLGAVLQSDSLIAKQALIKHIQQLVLTPKRESGGAVFEITGDLDLFAGEPRVVHSVPPAGYAMHYTFTLSLNGLQLKPGLSSGTRAATHSLIKEARRSKRSRISAQDQNVSTSAARSRPLEGNQLAAKGPEKHKTRFGKILRELLLEAPRRAKELYPVVLQRQPEDCLPIPCSHRKGVKSKGMEWQHEIQRELQKIALNLDGVWHLAERNAGHGSDTSSLAGADAQRGLC